MKNGDSTIHLRLWEAIVFISGENLYLYELDYELHFHGLPRHDYGRQPSFWKRLTGGK
jgi:hypothetical protein